MIAFNSHKWLLHAYDIDTGLHFIRSFSTNDQAVWVDFWLQLVAFTHSIGRQILAVITDADPKLGLQFRSKVLETGTFWRVTAPYTPAQAERAGGMIVVVARAMPIYAGLPMDLWPEAVAAAAYIINRLPTE
jgi:hypothetical protein